MAPATKTKAPEPAARRPAAPPPSARDDKSKQTANEIVKSSLGGPPSTLLDEMAKDAGKGLSSDKSDNLIPLIYILQQQSPQVNERDPKYINGAAGGDIWLRSAAEEIARGDEGILFQPCHFSKCVVEWIPRDDGGGFVARHEKMPEDAKPIQDPKNPNRKRFVSPRGTQYVETREHAGIVHVGNLRLPYVIPMSSSGHTVSRGWMTNMNGHTLPDGKIASSWRIEPAGWVENMDDYKAGRVLHDAFASGEKRGDAPILPETGGDEADGGGDHASDAV
jgi:hypothetical protein